MIVNQNNERSLIFKPDTFFEEETLVIAILIIVVIGALIAGNRPDLYLKETWLNASNLFKFGIICARLPLGLGGAGAMFLIAIKTYNLIRYCTYSEEVEKEKTNK